MPNYKGHFFGACLFYFILIMILSLYKKSFILLLCWFACTILGALFPDIDTSSKGKKLFFCLLFFSSLLCFLNKSYTNALLIISLASLAIFSSHRGIFHKLWFLLAISLFSAYKLIIFFPDYQNRIIFGLCFFISGFVSHLWLDSGFRNVFKF